jgi:hypothetical protein
LQTPGDTERHRKEKGVSEDEEGEEKEEEEEGEEEMIKTEHCDIKRQMGDFEGSSSWKGT